MPLLMLTSRLRPPGSSSPAFFGALFALIKPVIPAKTLSKFVMLGPVAPKRRGHKRRRVHLQRPPADSETANAATRNWRNAFLKIPRDAPPVPFQMPPPPTVPPEAAPH